MPTEPRVGAVEDGYVYVGGDPASENSWKTAGDVSGFDNAPSIGSVVDDHVFVGGDPSTETSWIKKPTPADVGAESIVDVGAITDKVISIAKETTAFLSNPIAYSAQSETVQDTVAEVGAAAGREVGAAADFFLSPVRLAARLAGTPFSLEDAYTRFTPGGEGGFMPEGTARDVAQGAGASVVAAGGLSPVQRSATKAADVFFDFIGIGATTPSKTAATEVSKRLDSLELTTEDADAFYNAVPITRGKKADKTIDKGVSVWSQALDGATETISRWVSPEVGARVERAVETATRTGGKMMNDIVQPMRNAIRLVDEDGEFKRTVINYARGHVDEGEVIATGVRKGLSAEDARAMRNFFRYSRARGGHYNRIMTDEDYSPDRYLHLNFRPRSELKNVDNEVIKTFRRRAAKEDTARLARTRTGIADEADEFLYDNPFVTHIRRLQENETYVEIAEKLGIRGTREARLSHNNFFNILERDLGKRLDSEELGTAGKDLIQSIVTGQGRVAPAFLRSFQNLSYMGTLMAPKSAVLNLHDTFVTAVNNGVWNTVKGLARNNGIDLAKQGLGDQSVGEFTNNLSRNLQRYANEGDYGEKVANATSKMLAGGMRVAGFKAMDRVGKRIVLSSLLENGASQARRGTLKQRWGEFFSDVELARMTKAFQRHGSDMTKMDPKDAKLVEEMAYAGLGQQQLISAAGRPVAWLNVPWLRPAYVLMGFAIKQKALLRKNVLDAMSEGRIKDAASYATRYVALAGGGYALLDEGRDYIFSRGEEDITGEELVFKTLVEQPLAVATLNKIGDKYSFERMDEDFWGFMIESVAPPGGITETVTNGIVQAIMDKDISKIPEEAERIPIIRFWKEFMLGNAD